MIVECAETFRSQITKGECYLVIEVLIDMDRNSLLYRIIDNDGCPAIYEAEKFDVISGNMNRFL